MKPSLLFSAFLIASAACAARAQDSVFILPFVPVESDEKEVPAEEDQEEEWVAEEVTDEESGDEEETTEEEPGDESEVVDLGSDTWFPGGWDPDWVRRGDEPDIFYTMTGSEGPADDEEGPEEEPDPEIDPVIYQTGVPALPKVSAKEKRAALQADIADGCAVTFGELDADDNEALSLAEFSAHRSGATKAHQKAFKRIDKNRNGVISLAEFSGKKSVPLVMPASMGILEASEYRAGFNALDFDGNGFLTFGEFTAVLRPSGPGILEAIFAEADQNGDGKISFAEYTHRPVNPAGVE